MSFLNFIFDKAMYEIYERLLKEKNLKSSDVARATGINPTTFTDWKKGKYAPKADKMQKIAEFLGVSVEFLRTGEEKLYTTESAEVIATIATDKFLNDKILKLMRMDAADKQMIFDLIERLSK